VHRETEDNISTEKPKGLKSKQRRRNLMSFLIWPYIIMATVLAHTENTEERKTEPAQRNLKV